MSGTGMTSMQRVLTTLGHKEPDRVPLFLLPTLHGAKELGLTIRDYYSSPKNVIEGQIRLRCKFKHDCIYAFFYAAIEMEAWGGETIFREDGPPNSGEPIIESLNDINTLEAPTIAGSPCLEKVLQTIEGLKARIGLDAPIIGVVMSPFSAPVMQMGFDNYLDLMFENREQFDRLMRVNEAFCISWANAQLDAGATAICYFDPISSPTITTPEHYMKTGFEVARRTLAQINGPTATHFASARTLAIADEIPQTGTAMIGVGCEENLREVKAAFNKKLTVVGNLNGIEMRHWTHKKAEEEVKQAIKKAGPGGGFILSDSHGEIPWQVDDSTLMAICEAVDTWGRYPLHWIEEDDEKSVKS